MLLQQGAAVPHRRTIVASFTVCRQSITADQVFPSVPHSRPSNHSLYCTTPWGRGWVTFCLADPNISMSSSVHTAACVRPWRSECHGHPCNNCQLSITDVLWWPINQFHFVNLQPSGQICIVLLKVLRT